MPAPLKHTPRWIVFLIDLAICLFSISFAYFIRFEFRFSQEHFQSLLNVVPVVIFIRAISFLIFRSYAGLIRYTSAKDTERIFMVVTAGSMFLFIGNFTYFHYQSVFFIPNSILAIDYIATTFIMIGSRLVVKSLYYTLKEVGSHKERVIIYGAEQFAAATKRTLDREGGSNFKVVAFVDV